MILRLRFAQGRPIGNKPGKNRHIATVAGSLLTPAAIMAYVLGLWRLGADMGVAGEFAMSGVLSHWQVWIGIGALLQLIGYSLNRYSYSGHFSIPQVLALLPRRAEPRREQDRRAS
jgi:hypothetical protein